MAKPTPVEETSAGGVVFRRADAGPLVLVIKDAYRNWGFPKGHLEAGEDAAQAAVREIGEETALAGLVAHGRIQDIDWFFRFRGRLIHKTCTFFLFECPDGEAIPQRDEGITACRWMPLEEALHAVSYANAREVLRAAGAMLAQLAQA
jgi:8-oxo-dGTP pyrophosphatase MutT (NUDIX family)